MVHTIQKMKSSNNKSSTTLRNNKARKRIVVEVIIAVLIILPAILLYINFKKLFINHILKAIELKPNTAGYNAWLEPPTSITQDYYLFNITNPIDIVTEPLSTRIHLKETRPYSYSLSSTKQDIQWSNDNKAISYSIHRLFNRHETRFNPSSVNDTGIFVDLLRATFRSQFGAKPMPAFYSLGGYNTFYARNAIEQLEGFTSDLFQTVRDKMVGPNTNKIGFVYRQNGSRLYNVSIQTDQMKKGQLLTFASELVPFNIDSPTYYPFPVYDSLTYPPMLFDKPALDIFNSDFCRPILIQYNQTVSMFGGIDMHEYKVKLVDYNNCSDPNDTRTCNEVDKLDVSKCISTLIPENTIFLSKAHFYGASNETMQEMNIEGFTPTSDKHDSVLYFEPYSGTPFKASYRMQLNVEATIDPMKFSEDGSELQPRGRKGVKRLIPVLWIDQEMNLPEEVINKLRKRLFLLQYGQYFIVPMAIVLTVIIIVIMEVMARRVAKNDRYTRGAHFKSETLVLH